MPKTEQREDYKSALPCLDIENSPSNPIIFFDTWYKFAEKTDLYNANVMGLSSAEIIEEKIVPNIRIVLLREYSDKGFIFYTNYGSRKAKEIEKNPIIAANFYWPLQKRQVRLQANIKRLPTKKSEDYFKTRPLDSQIGAKASKQSSILNKLSDFTKKIGDITQKVGEKKSIERPEHWGGYIFAPYYYEFWQGRENRLHERLVYENKNGKWEKHLLYP